MTTQLDQKTKNHEEICRELNDLYDRKNHDYDDSFSKSFKEDDLAMVRIRLGDKLNRFNALSRSRSSQVTDESIEDTLKDLANYAIMTIMELREEKQ